ncbi:hypothetical protein SAMN05444166_6869 [Singulisphaera sp. GP187]|nr:hypothetical protein SAMN05444166_6869 [Singulisphaera sp. GP187]
MEIQDPTCEVRRGNLLELDEQQRGEGCAFQFRVPRRESETNYTHQPGRNTRRTYRASTVAANEPKP